MGLYSSSITINYMDGEYVFYLIAIESDGAGNVIYSTVKVLRLIVDTKAPKVLYSSVEIDENVVYNANVTGVPSITFTVSEERESATLFKYSIDGGSLSSRQDTNTNPYIEIKGDGEHTIMVCDLDIAHNCLNSKTYNIKVDASSPDIELKYGDTAITTSSTIGYTILVANRTIPTFETDIVIEDTSFDYVDITVDAVHYVNDTFTITVTSNTTVNVTINGKVYTVGADGKVAIDTTALPAGEYIVNAVVYENAKYYGNSTNATFTIVKHNAEIISVVAKPTIAVDGQNTTITVTMANVTSGSIVIEVNGVNYTVPIANSIATLNSNSIYAL